MKTRFLTNHKEMAENRSKHYESPVCTEMEIDLEGILCASGYGLGAGHDGIFGDDDDIFNE